MQLVVVAAGRFQDTGFRCTTDYKDSFMQTFLVLSWSGVCDSTAHTRLPVSN
jgi:hypothetical protein